MDKKALRILYDTHWSTKGSKSSFECSDLDFEYAKSARMMFDAVSLTHQQIVDELVKHHSKTSRKSVSDAFLVSLSTRRLDLRSVLGSYAFATNFPNHGFLNSLLNTLTSMDKWCSLCGGFILNGVEPTNLNVLNFERFKWGGVRRLDPIYAWFDLREFARTEHFLPTAEDHKIFCSIVNVARGMKGEATVSDLEKSISDLFPSNKAERRVLIEILGIC